MLLNLLPPTNLETVLKNTSVDNITDESKLESLFEEHQIKKANTFTFDLLETDKIYHINAIKKVCVDYRLRFLDLKFFKNTLPQEAKDKIEGLEKQHNTSLADLKVMAPSALFRLESTDDPLLFVPLGNDYFYLIHKWGNDLKPLRKIRMWPFKNIWNLLLLIFGLSFLATELTPLSLFTKTPDGASYWMLFFFMFKALASIVLFYGFALGKNFNPAIWNNKYNKA
jgi:hypothetical protein